MQSFSHLSLEDKDKTSDQDPIKKLEDNLSNFEKRFNLTLGIRNEDIQEFMGLFERFLDIKKNYPSSSRLACLKTKLNSVTDAITARTGPRLKSIKEGLRKEIKLIPETQNFLKLASKLLKLNIAIQNAKGLNFTVLTHELSIVANYLTFSRLSKSLEYLALKEKIQKNISLTEREKTIFEETMQALDELTSAQDELAKIEKRLGVTLSKPMLMLSEEEVLEIYGLQLQYYVRTAIPQLKQELLDGKPLSKENLGKFQTIINLETSIENIYNRKLAQAKDPMAKAAIEKEWASYQASLGTDYVDTMNYADAYIRRQNLVALVKDLVKKLFEPQSISHLKVCFSQLTRAMQTISEIEAELKRMHPGSFKSVITKAMEATIQSIGKEIQAKEAKATRTKIPQINADKMSGSLRKHCLHKFVLHCSIYKKLGNKVEKSWLEAITLESKGSVKIKKS